nr:hypothetical protein 10 [bacterium]
MAEKSLIPEGILSEETIAFNDIIDRLFQIDLSNLAIYDIDNVDPSLFPYLSKHLHITNQEGWWLADTDTEKRALIKNALEIHRYKGTKYAIKEVLKKIGVLCDIVEWYEKPDYLKRGEFAVNLEWRKRKYSIDDIEKIKELINEYKNVRSHLKEVALEDTIVHTTKIAQMSETVAYAKMDNSCEYQTASQIDIPSINSSTIETIAKQEESS